MTALEALIGQARLASCDVASRDLYVACACADHQHADEDRHFQQVWGDGGYDLAPVWRETPDEAARDALHLGDGAHVVASLALVVTAPDVEVVEP